MKIFSSFCIFVEGIYLLYTDCITPEDLEKSKILLSYFVHMFSSMYGERYVQKILFLKLKIIMILKKPNNKQMYLQTQRTWACWDWWCTGGVGPLSCCSEKLLKEVMAPKSLDWLHIGVESLSLSLIPVKDIKGIYKCSIPLTFITNRRCYIFIQQWYMCTCWIWPRWCRYIVSCSTFCLWIGYSPWGFSFICRQS